jgi:phage shock protein PspC (stress-responsive transcriptional regulator)
MSETKSCPACFESIDSRASRCARCGQHQPDAPGLFRDVPGRLMGGVCASLALHFNWDMTLTRVAAVALMALSGGVVLWAYLLLWVMTPFQAGGRVPALRFVDWVWALFSPQVPHPDAPTQGPRHEL